MINVQDGAFITETYYNYEFTDRQGNGFSFPCEIDGFVDFDKLTDAAIANFDYCIENQDKFDFVGVREYHSNYYEPNYGICHCGGTVIFDRHNNYLGAVQCPKCGQWYNLFGQELLPPEEWDYGYED